MLDLLTGLIGFVFVGLSLGMLGGGGSILAVPVLVTLLAVPASTAVPMSLPVVGITAAVGAYGRWRKGQFTLKPAAMFAVAAMVASFAAARLGAGLGDQPRLIIFTVVMVLAALAMWWRAAQPPRSAEATPDAPVVPFLLLPAAVITGTLTGLVGVGGGFLIVPVLTGVLGLPLAQATGTSLAVIALSTTTAGIGWYGRATIDPWLTVAVTAAALVGMVIGTRLAPRFSARALTRAFAGLLLAVSAFTLWQAFRT